MKQAHRRQLWEERREGWQSRKRGRTGVTAICNTNELDAPIKSAVGINGRKTVGGEVLWLPNGQPVSNNHILLH